MSSQALGTARDRHCSARPSSSRGQSLVEFTLVLPIMLIILLVVADFGRLFAAGITIESATRNAAEIAAARYNRALTEPSIDYAEVHRLAWSTVCAEAAGLPNATPSGGSGECNGLPTFVCVHDGADGGCGAVYNTSSGTAGCPAVAAGSFNTMAGGAEKYVEVGVCYRFNTIFSMTIPSIGGPLESLGGDFYIERTRVFAVADY